MSLLPGETLRALDAGGVDARAPIAEPSAVRALLAGLALATGYFALDAASYAFWIEPVPVKPWNPQTGLAAAVLSARGLRYTPAVFAAALAAEVWLHHPGNPLGAQVLMALVLAAAIAAIAWALRRCGLPRSPTSVRATRDFFAVAALGAMLTAVAYVGTALLVSGAGFGAFGPSVLYRWLGDAAGMVGATPLALLALAPAQARPPVEARTGLALDAVALVGAIVLVVAVVFGASAPQGERFFYLLFLPLIVIAMRHGLPGAAIGVAAMQAAIVVALHIGGRTPDDAADYQFLMLALGATTLLLGAVAGERRRTQRELQRRSAELRGKQHALAEAMRVAAASETATTLAHEMAQPLSAMGTYARAGIELLRRGTATPGELERILDRIVAESARTRETVQRIREFFRTGFVRRERIDVGRLAADVCDALRERLRASQIDIALELPAGLPAVSADPLQIGTVLHNLVGNAADALVLTAGPRWIRVAGRANGAVVELDVADAGPGIDAAIRDKLFEPLATTKPTGMGLGLAIARKLVEAHGGHLEFHASSPTTFRITLPIHGPDAP